MRILVYEYFSGGGLDDNLFSYNIFSEGFGILKCLIEDFKADGHYVTTILDSRVINQSCSTTTADQIIQIKNFNDLASIISKISSNIDAAFILAPETNGSLQKILRLIKNSGIISLNCSISGINRVCNKAKLYKFLKEKNLKIPKSIFVSTSDKLSNIENKISKTLSYPILIKPLFGADCKGIKIIHDSCKLKKSIDKTKKTFGNSEFIIQEFIEGINASVCLLSTSSKIKVISLNKQDIILGEAEKNSQYRGGVIPFNSPLKKRAFGLVKKTIKSIPGLTGFIGVDLIFTNDEVYIIEINPRITTSYVGLREIISINVAKAIIDCKFSQSIPNRIKIMGHVFFSKIWIPHNLVKTFNSINFIKKIVPPLKTSDYNTFFSFISIKSKTKGELIKRIRAFEKIMKNRILRGDKL